MQECTERWTADDVVMYGASLQANKYGFGLRTRLRGMVVIKQVWEADVGAGLCLFFES
jgi:hypothetical protein